MRGFNLIIQPDAEEIGAAEVYVEGAVGGNPYRFLLDTGAAKTRIQFDEYTSTFPSTEQDSSAGVFARSSEDMITVPNIEVGPLVKHEFTLVRGAQQHAGPKNLIGMDFLKDFRCHFYFDDNRVSIDEPVEEGIGWQDLFLDKRFHPYIPVQFGGVTASTVWDTGASVTVADSNFIEKHPALFREAEAGQSTGIDSTGAEVATPVFMMSEYVIDGHLFPPQRVAAVDLTQANATLEVPMDLILGYTAYSKANWVFDFPRRKWTISKWLGTR